MERLFNTHKIRTHCAVSPLWRMNTLDPDGLDAPEKVIVPSAWESMPRLRNYRGRAVYSQMIECGGNVLLRLGGVSFQARVWLDDQLVAEHYDAYTGFETVVENVSRGKHLLRIEADNRFGEHSALHIPNDYYSYGGLTRPLVAEEVGTAYIMGVHVVPRKHDGVWHARVRIRIHSLSESGNGTLRVAAAGATAQKTVQLEPGKTSYVDMVFSCPEATVWCPENPVLTEIEAVLLLGNTPADDFIDRFGFRDVWIQGNQMLLNGHPLKIKGVNRHEAFNDFGACVPLEAMFRDLQLLKEMGVNCIRTCHYPNDPRFLDLCDEMGFLVWEESHSRGLSDEQMRNPFFMEQLCSSTEEMVMQHFNHPSVVIWGCLNECADNTEYGEQCYREIISLLHSLDDSRPVTAAVLERTGGRAFDAMDIVSFNMYPLWYYNAPVADSLQKKKAEIDTMGGAGKPIIVSEIGAGAIYGYHDPMGEAKWSEERQCSILKAQIESVLTSRDCIGVFLWQFADVRVDEAWAPHRPRTFNNKGVVDEYRRPKMAYAVVRDLFHKL